MSMFNILARERYIPRYDSDDAKTVYIKAGATEDDDYRLTMKKAHKMSTYSIFSNPSTVKDLSCLLYFKRITLIPTTWYTGNNILSSLIKFCGKWISTTTRYLGINSPSRLILPRQSQGADGFCLFRLSGTDGSDYTNYMEKKSSSYSLFHSNIDLLDMGFNTCYLHSYYEFNTVGNIIIRANRVAPKFATAPFSTDGIERNLHIMGDDIYAHIYVPEAMIDAYKNTPCYYPYQYKIFPIGGPTWQSEYGSSEPYADLTTEEKKWYTDLFPTKYKDFVAPEYDYQDITIVPDEDILSDVKSTDKAVSCSMPIEISTLEKGNLDYNFSVSSVNGAVCNVVNSGGSITLNITTTGQADLVTLQCTASNGKSATYKIPIGLNKSNALAYLIEHSNMDETTFKTNLDDDTVCWILELETTYGNESSSIYNICYNILNYIEPTLATLILENPRLCKILDLYSKSNPDDLEFMISYILDGHLYFGIPPFNYVDLSLATEYYYKYTESTTLPDEWWKNEIDDTYSFRSNYIAATSDNQNKFYLYRKYVVMDSLPTFIKVCRGKNIRVYINDQQVLSTNTNDGGGWFNGINPPNSSDSIVTNCMNKIASIVRLGEINKIDIALAPSQYAGWYGSYAPYLVWGIFEKY